MLLIYITIFIDLLCIGNRYVMVTYYALETAMLCLRLILIYGCVYPSYAEARYKLKTLE
jgi:hypothetical protein